MVVKFQPSSCLRVSVGRGIGKSFASAAPMFADGRGWRGRPRRWVTLQRIQFAGACNPPTDPGRCAFVLGLNALNNFLPFLQPPPSIAPTPSTPFFIVSRVPLTHRFLRWAPLLFVDFPSADSLTRIYGAFLRAILRRGSSGSPAPQGKGGECRSSCEHPLSRNLPRTPSPT